jgi:hypothetical protein
MVKQLIPKLSSAMYLDCSFYDPEEAFMAQAPQTRCLELYNAPPQYSPIIRTRTKSSCPSPSPTELYEEWQSTGKIAIIRQSASYAFVLRQSEPLLKAYEHITQLHDDHFRDVIIDTHFRDALVDAIAEVLDDHGLNYFNWKLLESATKSTGRESPLKRLVAFFFVLSTSPDCYNACLPNDNVFKEMVQEELEKLELEKLKVARTYRSTWKEFMERGRCRFHEHVGGHCWRGASNC